MSCARWSGARFDACPSSTVTGASSAWSRAMPWSKRNRAWLRRGQADVTLPQGLSFAVVGGMLVLFAWDRWRYDIVALVALLAAVACGIVPTSKAFGGFSNQVLPLIASVLVVSTAAG